MSLVQELKQDHATLVQILTSVKEMGVNNTEGREKLMSAKEGLLNHLAKEDQKLYPVLHKAAESDDGIKSMLKTFAADMDEISAAALAFFDKYEDGGSPLEFAKDFGALAGALGNRIRKEESLLYPEFDKLAK